LLKKKGNNMAAPAVDPRMINASQRALVTGNAQRMVQPIASQTFNPNNTPTINIQPRPVGLITGFIVQITGGITNGATTAANRTGLGSANAVQNITFTDLNSVQRLNTSGSHLAILNSARQGFGFGGAYAPNLPMGFGNNWAPFSAPAQLAANATGMLTHTYLVPVAYSSNDLRGAIYAAIINATMNLQITVATSAQLAVATGADPLKAVYIDNDNLAWTGNVTVNVYQVYYDQLPTAQNGAPILPMMDLNTIYDIKQTVVNGLSVGQEFPVDYANFRQFLSTMPIFDNGGSYNSGSDVNYWSIKSANSTELYRVAPDIAALEARQTFMADPPAGVYYFDHRNKPIDTLSYGNMQLVINPSVVNAGAQLVIGYEAFTQQNALGMATSLPGGN
jgi:hypothetical protein